MQVARYILQLALGIGLTLAVQLWHKQHLTDEQRARMWNTASWASALYAFGPLSMTGWVWLATYRWWGVPLGVVCAAVIAGAIAGIDALVAWAFGLAPLGGILS